MGREPARPEDEDNQAEAQRLQGVRAGLHPHRREIPAANGRRELTPPPFCGNRPGDALGLHSHFQGQDGGKHPALPARSGTRLPSAHPPVLTERAKSAIGSRTTASGKEFTDRLFGRRKRAATGAHEFDTLCAALDIDHRLTPPKSPRTKGRAERFNGRIEQVPQSHHFRSGEELETTPHRHVCLYNQQLPQSAMGSKTPLQAMKDRHKLKPELFGKQPCYRPGCDR